MASLRIINSLEMRDTATNSILDAHQGSATDLATTAFALTTGSAVHNLSGAIADSTATITLWSTSLLPATFIYFYYWADVDTWLQFTGASMNFAFKVTAKIPFVLCPDEMVIANNTTAISNDTEPATGEVPVNIRMNNYTGAAGNYRAVIIL